MPAVDRVRAPGAPGRQARAEVGRDPAPLPRTWFVNVRVLAPGEAAAPGERAAVGVAHLIVRFEQQGLAGPRRFAPVIDLLDRGR